MKKALLLIGLLGWQGWAEACSPIPAPKGFMEAIDALNKAKAKQQNACRGYQEINCTVYNVPPSQVVKWLVVTGDRPVKHKGYWTFGNETYGRTTTVAALASGTLVSTIDKETAYERLSENLYRLNDYPHLSSSCRMLGLTNTSYQVSGCKWQKRDSEKELVFTITGSQDKSLESGAYAWRSHGTCGYALEGPLKE